jgi:hypothetical protein
MCCLGHAAWENGNIAVGAHPPGPKHCGNYDASNAVIQAHSYFLSMDTVTKIDKKWR